MSHSVCMLILSLALLSCATSSKEVVRGGAPSGISAIGDEAIHVSLLVEAVAKKDGRRRHVAPHETLENGDRLALWVEVERPSYVYIAHEDAGGQMEVIFPEKGDLLVEPGKPLRIPEGERSFEVGGQAGEESLFVLASRRPERALDRLAQSPPPPPPPPPPPTMDYPTRQGGPAPILRARSGKGVAMLRFPFRHR